MEIKLNDLLINRTFREAGIEVSKMIEENMPQKFIIDMKDSAGMPTLFMNAAFAPLIDKYGTTKTKSKISFKNLTKIQRNLIIKYFEDYSELKN